MVYQQQKLIILKTVAQFLSQFAVRLCIVLNTIAEVYDIVVIRFASSAEIDIPQAVAATRSLHCANSANDWSCWECQRNNEAVYSTNLPDELKSEQLHRQEQHLDVVQAERSLYNNMVHESKLVAQTANIKSLGAKPADRNFVMHHSFNFAQQVHFLSDPLQPRPM
jgi:hypothetical protein